VLVNFGNVIGDLPALRAAAALSRLQVHLGSDLQRSCLAAGSARRLQSVEKIFLFDRCFIHLHHCRVLAHPGWHAALAAPSKYAHVSPARFKLCLHVVSVIGTTSRVDAVLPQSSIVEKGVTAKSYAGSRSM